MFIIVFKNLLAFEPSHHVQFYLLGGGDLILAYMPLMLEYEEP